VGASLVVCCVLAVPTVCGGGGVPGGGGGVLVVGVWVGGGAAGGGGGGVPCWGKHIIIIRFVLYIRVHKYKNERVRLARCVVHSYFYASF